MSNELIFRGTNIFLFVNNLEGNQTSNRMKEVLVAIELILMDLL
jgi:hypothetical protein